MLLNARYIGLIFAVLMISSCVRSTPEKTEEIIPITEKTPAVKAVKPNTLAENPCVDVACFKNYVLKQGKVNQQELDYFFQGVEVKPKIIELVNKPGTSRPWYQFKQSNISQAKFKQGARFLQENYQQALHIEQSYGVSKEVIVAVLGIETNYGSFTGGFRVADALNTLAFNFPRRAGFFQQELYEFILMTKEQQLDPLSLKGSYAGAMGMSQFMPSSYRSWAKSYTGKKYPDIWHNKADAMASIANYLKTFGWQKGGKIMIPVLLEPTEQLENIMAEKTALKRTVGDYKAMGVIPMDDIGDNQRAFLFKLEVAPNQFEYYLGLNNFYAIWKYNNSRLYVSAVKEIMDGISQKMQ